MSLIALQLNHSEAKMLYTLKGQYPTTLPQRIRLQDGSTRTRPFSEEFLQSQGYRQVDDPPAFGVEQKLEWTGVNWLVSNKSQQEIDSHWNEVRKERDEKIKEVEWRYNRYYRHERLGLAQVDSIQNLDAYVQALADITKQENPFSIVWPSLQD